MGSEMCIRDRVHAGLTKEGFPNVFLEAWASRVSVVSLYVDPDGLLASGLGYRCDSVEAAAELIKGLVADETRWATTLSKADSFVRSRDISNPEVQEDFLKMLSGDAPGPEPIVRHPAG